jgi:hypothetical protein
MSRRNPANPVDAVPVKRLAFNPATGTHEVRTPTAKFIKGPIPLEWISRANALPGKAGAVGMSLWFLVGVQGSRTVKLTGEVEKIAGCGRKAVYQALDALAAAGFISCSRKAGSRAVVTLLDCHNASSGAA